MKIQNRLWVLAIIAGTFFTSCSKNNDLQYLHKPANDNPGISTENSTITENFETGSKTAYAAGDVTLTTGSWNMNDALIGNSSSDRKNGTQSARIRNTGTLTMNFDLTSGATSVSIKHAIYGTDGSSNWELWASTNSGSTYAKVGNTITTSSTTLQTATFTVNYVGNVRFQVKKVSGGANRINIDDIAITYVSTPVGNDDDNMLMGNPSNATPDVVNINNYLMDKGYYIISYSKDRATPNWVSWHVHNPDLGSTPRQDDFRADNTLPTGWYQVGSTHYSGSGFDRGHNCPSADRTSTVAANSSTFLMTNMIPQAPYNNQQTWANLEDYTRSLVTSGSEVYVIMGSYGVGGTGSNGSANTINAGKITVPSNIWKVIVVLPNGSNDLSRVNTSTRVISVNTPNINTINSDWRLYRTSVDAIEAATGFNLLSNVPVSVQNVIEAVVDNL